VSEKPRDICTIVAKNYVSFARTLCESFQAVHPAGRCHVLFIDRIDGYVDPAKERFLAYQLDEIGIPDGKGLRFRYNVTELATAVKPFFLRFLLSRPEIREILYLDPDILVLGTLEKLFDLLETRDVVLTPHLDTDYPDDGRFPDDSHILKSGMFNLGFLGVGRSGNAERFLDWWAEKMRVKCVIDHGRGYFVDQRFIDLAFTLFENMHVEKDTGYNVAYWNLHSRRVERKEGVWFCNGKPLYFFHFSNYKPGAPSLLSAFQDRIRLADHPELQELFSLYAGRLARNGYHESRDWPYTHGKYADNGTIADEDRRVYRAYGERLVAGDPFDRAGYPWRLRLAMHGARLFGRLRHWIRDRAVRKDGPIRKIAKAVYGNFPTRDS
jgi:hypothetical protein